ncbi:MAG: hypothetical protein V1756_01290 [Patescibacteria group bacterium]
MPNKIVGWVLLTIGIGIIIWTLVSSYDIFTDKRAIPEIFPISEVNFGNSQATGAEAQLENMVGNQLKNLIPADAITKTLNLASWSILAFILIFGGMQIAGIGTKLLNKQ